MNKKGVFRFVVCVYILCFSFFINASAFSSQGSCGKEVYEIQLSLWQKGYYKGKADGEFTQKLTDAVKQFQKDFGLYETGVCTKAELSLLGVEEITPFEYESELLCIAEAIGCVCPNESTVCRIAVGAVILNRAKLHGISVFQSSKALKDNFSSRNAVFDEQCISDAFQVLMGADPTFGATYITRTSTPDPFIICRKKTAEYGSFSFYI